MIRAVLAFVLFCCFPFEAIAATANPMTHAAIDGPLVTDPGVYAQIVSDYPLFHQFWITTGHEIARLTGLLVWVIFIVVAITTVRAPSADVLTARYATWAASARSRTRWIMARRPFDRCDDRWSLSSNRANSAEASTSRSSRAVRPL